MTDDRRSARELDEVRDERHRQDEKWGEQDHEPLKWLAILGEEYGEAQAAVLEGSLLRYHDELVQVAAVAVAALECLSRGKWASLAEREERAGEMPGEEELAAQIREVMLDAAKPAGAGETPIPSTVAAARFVLSRFRPDQEALDRAMTDAVEWADKFVGAEGGLCAAWQEERRRIAARRKRK